MNTLLGNSQDNITVYLFGQGVEKLRALVLSMALDEKANSQEGQRHHLQAMENVYFEIMKLKKENILFVTWSWIKTLKGHWNEMDEHALFAALGELNDMVSFFRVDKQH